jgi:integrase-like protein
MSGPMTSLRIAPMMVASTGEVSISQKTQRYRKISPWENGYIESFNARLRDELLNGEILGLALRAEPACGGL